MYSPESTNEWTHNFSHEEKSSRERDKEGKVIKRCEDVSDRGSSSAVSGRVCEG